MITLEKALDTAVLAFEDGLMAVFVDGLEIRSLHEQIHLHHRSEIAFIRLTFLAGRSY